jgi:uncharacterized NAD(P)/FAD-binding protein YdhS
MRTIAIIGAGFSGTATAVHLLRRARARMRIVLIDDQPETAAGLAYAPGQQDCLLNVPAGQMSLDASRPRVVVERIFNCTGPDYNPARSENALAQSLLTNGLIAPDPLELGIRVTSDGEVGGADGRVLKGLHYIGPWLRARDWEATAVPELREHARRLADRLSGSTVNARWRQESQPGAWTLAERSAAH